MIFSPVRLTCTFIENEGKTRIIGPKSESVREERRAGAMRELWPNFRVTFLHETREIGSADGLCQERVSAASFGAACKREDRRTEEIVASLILFTEALNIVTLGTPLNGC